MRAIEKLFAFIPGRGRGLILFAAIILLAFVLGFVLRGPGAPPPSEEHGGGVATGDHRAETVWTCSMHPQIRMPGPGKCPICFMDLIPVETDAGAVEGERRLEMTEAAVKLADIRTTPVERRFVEARISLTGNLAYDETRVTIISAWVSGRIEKVYADYTGITVVKGEPLVELYSPRLLAAQEELLQALKAARSVGASSSGSLRGTSGATLEAAREKLRLAGLTAEQIGRIERTGETTEQLTIHAPEGGVVVEKHAREGMYVATGTALYTIADLSTIWALFEAYQTDLPWLREGQGIEFTSPSFPGERFSGRIAFVDPVLDGGTRTARVRAVVGNPGGRLKPDMFVSGTVLSRLDAEGRVVGPGERSARAPLVIPDTAPLITGTRAVVYVRLADREEPVFEGREVSLGPRGGSSYIVRSGLSEGELVVTNGAFKIDSELQIRAKPSMMDPQSGVWGPGHRHEGGEPVHDRAEPANGGGGPSVRADAVGSLTPVYEAYFDLQMSLAMDDVRLAREGYGAILERIGEFDMNRFTGDAHLSWMRLSRRITDLAGEGKKSEDLAEARRVFLGLSKAFVDLHDTFGHAGAMDYFLAFCPMTDDGKGAFWLQAVDTVYNSFYGSQMLRCGTIEKKLPPTRQGTR